MMEVRRVVVYGMVFSLIAACSTVTRFDPIAQDLPRIDPALPPDAAALEFLSSGENINARLYIAQGSGPHPVVLIARGYPDYLGSLDLAMMLQRAGFNVLGFNYRGCWGSAGTFSLTHSVEDIASAVSYLRSEEARTKYRVDSNRIILMGYSLGGPAVLKAAAIDAGLKEIILIDCTDLRELFADIETPEGEKAITEALRSNAVRLSSTSAIVDDYRAYRNEWQPEALAARLAGKRILGIYASRGNGGAKSSWLEFLRASKSSELVVLDTDHGFSGRRITLARTVLAWIRKSARGSEGGIP